MYKFDIHEHIRCDCTVEGLQYVVVASVEVECACPRQVCTFACCSHDVSPELKKDPGIPNLYPFKEELLQQIEDKRQQVGQLCGRHMCELAGGASLLGFPVLLV